MGVPVVTIPGDTVARRILDVGFTDEAAIAAWAILFHESGGFNRYALNLVQKPDQADPAHHTLDKGIAQWNTRWWPDITEAQAFDWEWSIGKMFDVYQYRGFQDWAAFSSLRYLRHVPDAFATFEALT